MKPVPVEVRHGGGVGPTDLVDLQTMPRLVVRLRAPRSAVQPVAGTRPQDLLVDAGWIVCRADMRDDATPHLGVHVGDVHVRRAGVVKVAGRYAHTRGGVARVGFRGDILERAVAPVT